MSHISHVKVLAAAGLLTLALSSTLASTMARAADLYRDDPPPRAGPAYDDPRYADLYGNGPPPRHRPNIYPETYRSYEPAPPIPRERVYRDEREEYDRRFAQGDRRGRGCPSKDEISRMLERDGWARFENPQVLDGKTATVDAQRPNGRPYRLEVDRCTGEILGLRPIDGPRYGNADPRYAPYAGEYRRYRQY